MMNREIKFDIILWDGEDPSTIEHCNAQEAFREDYIEFDYKGCLVPTDDSSIIIREFTGLKDKNGKEIYEGDILNIDWEIETPEELDMLPITAIVEFHSGAFWFKAINASLTDCCWFQYDDKEVIGNIWENGDLLK